MSWRSLRIEGLTHKEPSLTLTWMVVGVLDGTGNVADTGTFVARLAVIISSVNTRVTIRDAKLTSIVGPFHQ
jgi:hypothetical protein